MLLLLAVSTILLVLQSAGGDTFYCLESYNPIGKQLRTVNISQTVPPTAGQFARQCAAACDAEAACSAFTSVGPGAMVTVPTKCLLLTGTAEAIPSALQIPAGQDWPDVVANVTSEPPGGVQLHSVEWLCIKGVSTWDSLGLATHALVHTRKADPNATIAETGGHAAWCAFGVDVAGNNLQQLTSNVDHPVQCDEQCQRNPACIVWVWIASQPGSGLAPHNCFLKADIFRGQNGWTGTPKADIWIPDSQIHCFDSKAEWEHLGAVSSPAILTIPSGNNTFYTVFPERVTWAEAHASCATLPQGRLAMLQDFSKINLVNNQLLATLPAQTAVRSAWVGATGTNSLYNPAAAAAAAAAGSSAPQQQPQQVQMNASTFVPSIQPGVNSSESTLTWQDGTRVEPTLLRRLQMLPSLWTVHDVVQAQVPATERNVCARVLQELPPPTGAVDSAAVLPGIWYFDCDDAASFICETSDPPSNPMHQLRVASAAGGSPAQNDSSNSSPADTSLQWKLPLGLGLPFLIGVLLGLQLYRTYSRKLLWLPDLIRQQRKRALGQPRSGRMSLVVTDIQGFTQLMRDVPDQMAQALLLHNQVVRHGVYDNVGYVLEQEGDSFTVAFHDAEDAVAFTLQVQQALLELKWPAGISYHDSWEATASLAAIQAACAQQENPEAESAGALDSADSLRTPLEAQQSLAGSDGAAGTAGSTNQQSRPSSSFTEAASRGRAPNLQSAVPLGSLQLRQHDQQQAAARGWRCFPSRQSSKGRGSLDLPGATTFGDTASADGAEGLERSLGGFRTLISFIRCRRGSAVSEFTGNDPASPMGSAASGWTHNVSSLVSATGHGTTVLGAAPAGAAGVTQLRLGSNLRSSAGSGAGSGTVVSRRRNQWLQQLLMPAKLQQPKLFCGLRVRMGVSTGVVPKGQEVKNSQLYQTAQDVSTAAMGGQVLVDEATFKSVKEGLWRLGAVLASGISYDLLYGSRHSRAGGSNSANSSSGSFSSLRIGNLLPSCLSDGSASAGRQLSGSPHADQALALDMGAYITGPVTTLGGLACKLWTGEQGAKLVQQYQQFLQQKLQQHMARSGSDFTDSGDADNPFSASISDDLQLVPAADIEQPAGTPLAALTMQPRSSLAGSASPRIQLHAGGSKQFGRTSWLRRHLSHGLFGISHHQPHPNIHQAASLAEATSADWDSATAAAHGLSSFTTTLLLPPTLRMYQIIAPSLIGRAVLFGHQLALPKTWQCLDPPYFAAPGITCAGEVGGRQLQAQASAGERAAGQQQHGMGHAVSLQSPGMWRQLSSAEAASAASGRWMTDPGSTAAAAAGAGASGGAGAAAARNSLETAFPEASDSNSRSLQLPPPPWAAAQQEQQQAVELATSIRHKGSSSDSNGSQPFPPNAAAAPIASSPFNSTYLSPFFTSQSSAEATAAAAADAAAHATSAGTSQLQNATGTAADVHLAEPTAALLATSATAAARQALQEAAEQQQLQPPSADVQEHQQQAHIQVDSGPHTTDSSASTGQATSNTAASGSPRLSHSPSQPTPAAAGDVPTSSHRQQHSRQHSRWHHRRSSEDLSVAVAGAAGSVAALSRGSEVASSQLAQLRIASLKPSMGLGGSSKMLVPGLRHAAGAGAAGTVQFSPVAIVFATVEGGSQLTMQPGMARLVHLMLHRLLLQLLRSFPGSYLVRAQGGDLKYMAAFSSTTAAAAWCLTVQEAALYLPYPQQLLALNGFGIQLDEAGRLMFRGPRLKMGLAEGTPKCILPDFMGRADFHGPFVNQAARFADAAAHGGQVVADADTARNIFHQWHCSTSSSSSGSLGRSNSSSSRFLGSFSPGNRRTSIDAVAAAVAGSPGRRQQQQQSPQHRSLGPSGAEGPTAGLAADLSEVAVEGWWLGSFVYKGSPLPVDMVALGPKCLAGRSYPVDAPSGKGLRVVQRVGLMDQAVVALPAQFSSFWGS